MALRCASRSAFSARNFSFLCSWASRTHRRRLCQYDGHAGSAHARTSKRARHPAMRPAIALQAGSTAHEQDPRNLGRCASNMGWLIKCASAFTSRSSQQCMVAEAAPRAHLRLLSSGTSRGTPSPAPSTCRSPPCTWPASRRSSRRSPYWCPCMANMCAVSAQAHARGVLLPRHRARLAQAVPERAFRHAAAFDTSAKPLPLLLGTCVAHSISHGSVGLPPDTPYPCISRYK